MDWAAIRERYMRDDLPVRLGGLASNLSRVKSFAANDTNMNTVEGLLEESKFFIEWTARELDANVAAQLVELQVELACWQRDWASIWSDLPRRRSVAERAGQWSRRVLELSGLLE